MASPVFAQNNLAGAIQQTYAACAGAGINSVCYGSGAVQAQDSSGASVGNFAQSGDTVEIASVASLSGDADSITLLRLSGGLDSSRGKRITAALFGDVTLENSYDAALKDIVCTVANQNPDNLSIYILPDTGSQIVGEFAPATKTQANGRADGTDWYRIVQGDKLGWILTENVAIDCEPETLAEVSGDDVAVLYRDPGQALTLTGGDSAQNEGLLLSAPRNSRARVILNGVQIYLSGSVFVTEAGNALTITGLEGTTEVISRQISVTVLPGQSLTADASTAPAAPAAADTAGLPDLLNSLVYGQPYDGAGSTISGLSVQSAGQPAADDLVRVSLSYTGEAGLCPVAADTPVSVVFAADISPTLSPIEIGAVRAGAASLIETLNLSVDSYAAVVFRSQSLTVNKLAQTFIPADFETAFNATVSKLQSADAELVSDFSAGLSTSISLLKSATTPVKVIVLVSDGTSDAETIQPILEEARTQGILIKTIAVGDAADAALLASLTQNPDTDAFEAGSMAQLAPTAAQVGYALRRPVAASDVTVTYTVSDDYEILDSRLIETFGGQISGKIVTWNFPVIYDTQRVDMPLALIATGENAGVPGTVQVALTACGAGGTEVESDGLAAPVITPLDGGNVDARQGILGLEQTGSGSLAAFGTINWLVDTDGTPVFSVITSGANTGLNVFLTGTGIEPVYTLTNFDGNGRNLSVFVSEESPLWVSLQSTGARAAGTYEVTVSADTFDTALPALTPGAQRLNDQQVNNEGRVYTLDDVAAGDTVTLRYGGTDECFPVSVMSLDGQPATEIFTRYDADKGEWNSVQVIEGAGPYRVIVKTSGKYGIDVQAGDIITDERGELVIGERISQTVANTVPVPVKYTLNVPAEDTFSFNLSGGVTSPALRTADNELVRPIDRISVNRFVLDKYELPAGDYTVYLTVSGSYSINVIQGTVAPVLKGVVNFGVAQEGASAVGAPLAVFNIVSGSGKPLFEGDLVTVNVGNTVASNRSVFVENVNGEAAEYVSQFVDDENERFIGVYRLVGKGPYRLVTAGLLERYVFTVNRDDLLNNNKGSIVIGQTLRDSSNAPRFLNYTLAPEFGKNLGEGDIVTIGFRNQGAADDPFFPPDLLDGKENPLGPTRWLNFGRQFVGVFELQGTAPYRLRIPNIGAYSLSLDIGDKMVLAQGELELDTDVRGVTDGTQQVNYDIEGKSGDAFTIRLEDLSGSFRANDLDATLRISNSRWNGSVSEDTFVVTSVYVLEQDGPQTLSFALDGEYLLKVIPGDDLNKSGGVFFLGDAETTENEEANNKRLTYDLEITGSNQALTIDNTQFYFLYDPNGQFVPQNSFIFKFDRGRYRGTRDTYTLQDTGTYKLVMFPDGQYTLRVSPQDLLTANRGNVYYNITETDKLKDDERFAVYTLNAQPDDVITVRLEIDRINDFFQREVITIFDADGNPISEERLLQDDGYYLIVYELSGKAPYTLQVQPERRSDTFYDGFNGGPYPQETFRLTVYEGDVSYIRRGEVPLDTEYEDEWEEVDGMRTLINIFQNTKPEPRDITIDVEAQNGLFYANSLRVFGPDSKDVPVKTIDTIVKSFGRDRLSRKVFTLPGTGSYEIHVEMVGEYTIKVVEGDQLSADYGEIVVNPRNPEPVIQTDAQGNQKEVEYKPVLVKNRFNQQQTIGTYHFDPPDDSVISVRIKADLYDGYTNPVLLSNDGQVMFPFDVGFGRSFTVLVYELIGDAPYHLSFETNTAGASHEIQIDEGNSLIQDFDPLFLNPNNPPPVVTTDARGNTKEEPYEPVVAEAELEDPAVLARFDIPAFADSVVTLTLEQNGNTPPDGLILNGDGEPLLSQDAVQDGGSLMTTVKLTGAESYTLYVQPSGDFTATLTDGDALVANAGSLPVGLLEEPFTNELPAPARIAQHTLDVEPGQFVTLEVASDRSFVPVTLKDSEGTEILPTLFDYQDNVNVYIYLLSGISPYTVRFPAIEEYEVTARTGNLLRVDRGILDFFVPAVGELETPGRVVTYNVNGKRDQLVTVKIQDNRRPVAIEFRDANGKLWEPKAQAVQDNFLYNLYELGGPSPYQITFASEEEYNLTVSDGNILRVDLGDVVLGEPVKSELEPPAMTAVYGIPAESGQIISIRLQANNRPFNPRVFNGEDVQLVPLEESVQSNAAFAIYSLTGGGPYYLEFETSGNYDLTVSDGNILLAEQGAIEIGERTNATLKAPAQIAAYTFDAPQGSIYSVALQVGGRPADGELTDADGNKIDPQTSLDRSNIKFNVYALTGAAPYRLTFSARQGYNVIVSPGNVLRADLGLIRFGNTITDRLADAETAAFFLIDAQPGEKMTLKLADNNRPLIGELTDADGEVLLPMQQASTTNAAYTTYVLTGKAPYLYTFTPKGSYSITLTEGNAFRAEMGIAPFGQELRNRLEQPVLVAAYQIYTAADQVISIQLTAGRAEFMVPRLLNAEGEIIEPQTQVYNGNNTFVGVYTLTGSAPYIVEFDIIPRVDYTLKLTRGDASLVEVQEVGPQAQEQNRLPGQRPRR